MSHPHEFAPKRPLPVESGRSGKARRGTVCSKGETLMKSTRYTIVVICILSIMLLMVPVMAAPGKATSKGGDRRIEPLSYKPGEAIVIWKDGVTPAEKAIVDLSAGVERVQSTAAGKARTDRELLKLEPGTSTEAAVNALRESPAVEAAGYNWLRKLDYTPSSPDFPKQWGLNNTGQTIEGQPGTPDADIDAAEAWDIERGNSNATTLAVIDSGVDLTHPNLSGRLWTNSADPVNGVDDDGNGYVDDYNGYNFAGISNYGASNFYALGQDSNSQFVAQKFRAQGVNSQCPVAGLEMYFYGKIGTPSQTITYAIRSSLSGANIAATNPISPSRIAASGSSFVYEPFTSVAYLTPGNDYYFVVYTSATDASNFYRVVDHKYAAEGYDSYVEGSEWWNRSGTWTEYPDDDFYFKASGYYYNRDNNGHGTHCSGIVGAADSGAGSVGVAPGSVTRLMALKAGDSSGSLWSSDWMDAIDYASSMGADVVSMSFGGTGSDPVEQTVITNAYNNGVALFASSGNSGDSTIQYPVAYNNVIGVGATDNTDTIASFSTYNSSVDVSAPGVDYYSTMPNYPVTLNEFGYTQNYDYLSGTSMACPCAAGVGALVRSKNPAYTPAQIQSRLQSTAKDLGSPGRDDYYGYGRISAFQAVNTVPSITAITPTSATRGQTLNVSIVGSNTHFVNGTSTATFSGTGITVNSTTVTDATHATANITISPSAPTGSRDVNLITGSETPTSLTGGFTVNLVSPTVTSITPNNALQHAIVDITNLAGTGFIAGATVRLENGTAVINATDVNVVSSTQITCKFNLGGVIVQKYDVVVKNPDAQEGRLTQGFTVNAPANPCGGGAAGSIGIFGIMMGLMSLAGSAGLRRRFRKKR